MKLIDNSWAVMSEIDKGIYRGLEICGGTAERFAKDLAPVDTGRLKGSITHVVEFDEKAVYIGTNVEYAPYQEYGTSRMGAANGGIGYIRPAIMDHTDDYNAILGNEIKKALESMP